MRETTTIWRLGRRVGRHCGNRSTLPQDIVGGANTVTVTFNQAAAFPDVRILEYRGVSAPDVTAARSGNSSTASSGTATTTSANELIFGANVVFTSTDAVWERMYEAHYHVAGRGYCGRQGGERDRQLLRERAPDLFWALGDADGYV